MLISCTSCNSRYLVNSADLKPDGRTVQCAKCGNQWYQSIISGVNKDIFETVSPSSSSNNNENINPTTPNLPSTYVKEQKVSILNSVLAILFVLIFIGFFLIIPNIDLNNNIVLIKFYFNEFIFNLKLIFNDIAKIIYKIIN